MTLRDRTNQDLGYAIFLKKIAVELVTRDINIPLMQLQPPMTAASVWKFDRSIDGSRLVARNFQYATQSEAGFCAKTTQV